MNRKNFVTRSVTLLTVLSPGMMGSAAALSVMMSGCASAGKQGRILRTENGKTAAIGTAKTGPDATLAAVDIAEDYCEESKQKPIFANDLLDKPSKEGAEGELDFKKLPVVGKMLKSDDPAKVTLESKCG